MPISTISSAGLATGGIGRSNMYTGAVLQVVQASTTTETTLSSTSYTDTSLTGTITPTSATSKILVMVNQQARLVANSNPSGAGFKLRLLRGATNISDFGSGGANTVEITADNGGNVRVAGYTAVMYLDSPATTSATTYKTQAALVSPYNASFQGSSTAVSIITLMEIAA
jgi:hypothetical protein